MDFHFAKHLSPLVLVSECEISFDCPATVRWAGRCGSRASGLLCIVTEWGSGQGAVAGHWELLQGTNRCSPHSQPCAGGCS